MRTDAQVAIVLAVLACLFGASYFFVSYREHACAQHCQAAGFPGYDYHGFSGGGRKLSGDSCKCTNAGSLSPPRS